MGINIFDRSHTLHASYNNTNIASILLIDDDYLYCLSYAAKKPIDKIEKDLDVHYGFKEFNHSCGLFVYDLHQLLKFEKIENYKLASALVGINTNLSYYDLNNRMSFFKDFNKMESLPIAHRNTINFLGMGVRQDYLIWREKNGFFTALGKNGNLRTWSVASGKLLYRYKKKYKPEEMKKYVIY